MTLDDLLASRDLNSDCKLVALWVARAPQRTYHRDEVAGPLGLSNFRLEQACRRLQHPDVRILEGDDPCDIRMRADHPLRVNAPVVSSGRWRKPKTNEAPEGQEA